MVNPGLVDRLAILAGAALIIVGACSWSVRAALVTAGVLLIAGTVWRKA